MVLLAGASGSGKSTLLRAACGLVPHFFGGTLAGRVRVWGRDTRDAGARRSSPTSVTARAPGPGVAGRDERRARRDRAAAREPRRAAAPALARAVEETALALGIADLLERPVRTLSGGELQRVALAAALVARPRLLLLDEPTSQLDPVAGDELIWQLRRLNEERGTTVVLAEHRLERCLAAADRVIALERGRVAFDAHAGGFVDWAADRRPALLPPAARMFALAGLRPLPVSVKEARARCAGPA